MEIYKKARITAYLKSKGREVDQYNNHWMACCPFHDDTHPSMIIHRTPQGGQAFNCYACQKQGSILTVMAHMEKRSKAAIFAELCKKFNVK